MPPRRCGRVSSACCRPWKTNWPTWSGRSPTRCSSRAGCRQLRSAYGPCRREGLGLARVVLPLLVACERSHTLAGAQSTAKGMVAYVGLDPQPHESGTSLRSPARSSRQGDQLLRARLSMGALGALRGDHPLHAFSQRLVDRGKPKQVAWLAAARKLLAWAWAVFRSGQPFDATKTVKLVA